MGNEKTIADEAEHQLHPRGPRSTIPPSASEPNVLVGCLVGLDSSGRALVEIDGRASAAPLAALCAIDTRLEVGDSLAISFVGGDPARPLIVGRLQAPRVQAPDSRDDLLLEADRQVTLRCGKSSLTLTRAGKILIRGEYVSSQSSGVNRLKGGSVQIN